MIAISCARFFSPISWTEGCGLIMNPKRRANQFAGFWIVLGLSFNVMTYSGLAPFDFCGSGVTGGVDGFTSWKVTVEFCRVWPNSCTVSRRMESNWNEVPNFVATSERNASLVARFCASSSRRAPSRASATRSAVADTMISSSSVHWREGSAAFNFKRPMVSPRNWTGINKASFSPFDDRASFKGSDLIPSYR